MWWWCHPNEAMKIVLTGATWPCRKVAFIFKDKGKHPPSRSSRGLLSPSAIFVIAWAGGSVLCEGTRSCSVWRQNKQGSQNKVLRVFVAVTICLQFPTQVKKKKLQKIKIKVQKRRCCWVVELEFKAVIINTFSMSEYDLCFFCHNV